MSDNRARIWFASFVLAVFCLGGAGGFFLGRQLPRGAFLPGGPPPLDAAGGEGFGGPGSPGSPGPRRGGPGRLGPPPFGRGPLGPPGELVNRLTTELQLDAAQQSQLRKILDDRRDRFEQVHRDARDRFEKEQRDLRDAIRATLRPDQQTRFDTFLDRRQ